MEDYDLAGEAADSDPSETPCYKSRKQNDLWQKGSSETEQLLPLPDLREKIKFNQFEFSKKFKKTQKGNWIIKLPGIPGRFRFFLVADFAPGEETLAFPEAMDESFSSAGMTSEQ